MSPRGFLKGYFREGQFFKESARNITQIHGRFIPKIVAEKNGDLAKALMDKKIDNAYKRFIKRQDKEKQIEKKLMLMKIEEGAKKFTLTDVDNDVKSLSIKMKNMTGSEIGHLLKYEMEN